MQDARKSERHLTYSEENFSLEIKVNKEVQPIFRFPKTGLIIGDTTTDDTKSEQFENYVLSTESTKYSILVHNRTPENVAFSVDVDGRNVGRMYIAVPGGVEELKGFFMGYQTCADGVSKVEIIRSFVFGASVDDQPGGFAMPILKDSLATIRLRVYAARLTHRGTAGELPGGVNAGGGRGRLPGMTSKERMESGVTTKEGRQREGYTMSGRINFFEVDFSQPLTERPVVLRYKSLWQMVGEGLLPVGDDATLARLLEQELRNERFAFKCRGKEARKRKREEESRLTPSSQQQFPPHQPLMPLGALGGRQQSHRQPTAAALRRLMRDLAEWTRMCSSGRPLDISASPLEDNMFEWHACLAGRAEGDEELRGRNQKGKEKEKEKEQRGYEGVVFHLVMEFPDDYPFQPPKIRFMTFLDHPNVINGRICLDMLNMGGSHSAFGGRAVDWGTNVPYTGWSSAYTVTSILLQLESFLKERVSDNPRSVRVSRLCAQSFECAACGHTNLKPWPTLVISADESAAGGSAMAIDAIDQEEGDQRDKGKEKIKPASNSDLFNSDLDLFSLLPDETVLSILAYLGTVVLCNASLVCRRFLDLVTAARSSVSLAKHHPAFAKERALIRQQLICFHSRAAYDEGDTILGFGLSVEYYPPGRSMEANQSGPMRKVIKAIRTPLDLVSYQAFEDGVRVGVWKEPFKLFLPIYIDEQHAERAMPLAEKTIALIAAGSNSEFEPLQALTVLCKLMSTMVVELNDGSIHVSIKALEGYCAFHRMLLYFADKYPIIRSTADTIIEKFVASESFRSKRAVPNLGEFLPLLAITSAYTWVDIASAYLEESSDRNAFWIIQKYPELALVDKYRFVDTERIQKSTEATVVSHRLLMFHVYFLRNIGKPKDQTPKQVIAMYDQFYGRPNDAMKVQLQAACRKFHQKANNWNDFLQEIGEPRQSDEELTTALVESLRAAIRKKYITVKKMEVAMRRSRPRPPERERTPPPSPVGGAGMKRSAEAEKGGPPKKKPLTAKQVLRMAHRSLGPVGEEPEMSKFVAGPLAVLMDAVTFNTQVLIGLRNGRKLLGRVRAFDRHMNMLLTDVSEMWVEVKRNGKRGKVKGTVNRDRFISKMLLRGDAVVMVIKNPKAQRSPTPPSSSAAGRATEGDEEEEKEKEKEAGEKEQGEERLPMEL